MANIYCNGVYADNKSQEIEVEKWQTYVTSELETVNPLHSLSTRDHWQVYFSIVKYPDQ